MKRVLLIALLALMVGCKATVKEDAVKVTYFFGDDRSETCLAMERLTKEVLDEKFAKEMKSGDIVFELIDIRTPEGGELAKEFETTGNALFISQALEGEATKRDLSRIGYIFASSEPENYKKELVNIFTNATSKGIAGMGAVRPQTQIEGC